jgi:hypothetical protein
MSRRWFRLSSPTAVSDLSPDASATALTTRLAGDLSRRLFGKRLLVAIPVAAAALLTEAPEGAEAGTDGDWTLSGNAIPDSTKFLGTTTAQPLIIKTNNIERVRILATGPVGIGASVPQARLHVKYTELIAMRAETSSTDGDATGVLGEVTTPAPSQGAAGVRGVIRGTNAGGTGVYGFHTGTGDGVAGRSNGGDGVNGFSSGTAGPTGVAGFGMGTAANGVIGKASGTNVPYGIWGIASSTDTTSAYAGVFNGDVFVGGTLSKAAGTFKIDHPLDPANKYLSHSFVESPDMMNVYNGNVRLGGDGTAVVKLPTYFEALNRDFRYQLTCIGGFAPVYVAETIKGNQFKIAGGTPGLEISWQVTGIRQDAWANAHSIQVEEDKPANERGTYLTPKEHGQAESKGRDYERLQRVRGQGSN